MFFQMMLKMKYPDFDKLMEKNFGVVECVGVVAAVVAVTLRPFAEVLAKVGTDVVEVAPAQAVGTADEGYGYAVGFELLVWEKIVLQQKLQQLLLEGSVAEQGDYDFEERLLGAVDSREKLCPPVIKEMLLPKTKTNNKSKSEQYDTWRMYHHKIDTMK